MYSKAWNLGWILKDSIKVISNSLEFKLLNSVCGTHPLKASSGERESVREGEGSDFAIQAPSPSLKNGRLEKYILLEDSKELKDSNKKPISNVKDSSVFNVESKLDTSIDSRLVSPLNSKNSTNSLESLESNKDSTLTLETNKNIESNLDS